MTPQDSCKPKMSQKRPVGIQINFEAPVYISKVELIKHLRNILGLN